MNKPILYSFRRCPYAMRARIFIKLCEIEVQLREVILRDIPQEMIAISPKATVPVLQLYEGTILEESLDIMDWAINNNDKFKLKKSKNDNIEIHNKILSIFDNNFKFHLDRYKYNSRYDSSDVVKSKEIHRDEALKNLYILEDQLDKNNSLWLFNNNPSFLDIAILPFIRQYRIADIKWFDEKMPYKNVHSWVMRFLEWDTFNQIMIKNKPWKKNDEPIYFGLN
ncbi:MAG: glutathione S-transferase [Pelagibacterales bacterium]|nr:glutathione S-transferase [Pelagibacterales bacterium]PPR16559.1 MAG: hypothetical protein CFH33_00589 [Alphaproteobacteria bacterium MarineAlpha9_Bin3]|tara:strand:- start:7166 stop:7837 length:672 start_codon:yes stop_codon:yes gene_type:complete